MSKALCHQAVGDRINGLVPCALLLAGSVLLLLLALSPLAIWLHGLAGLQPLAAAALINLLAGLAVLGVTQVPALRKEPLVSMLVATALRLVPLVAISLAVVLTRDKSAHLDFIGYLVLFHLATLAVETYVSVQQAQLHSKREKQA